MTFATREAAGRKLGERLAGMGKPGDLILGLPRGGVVVAAEVARVLRLPLDVVIVRKIGHPWHREFAVGAVAEGNVAVLDERWLARNPRLQAGLQEVIGEEQERLRDFQTKFRRGTPVERMGKAVILVDDGLATGATMEAAAKAIRLQGARQIIVAVPVASANAVERLASVADETLALVVDPLFDAVGRYYAEFPQTTDAEVLSLLRANEGGTP